MKVVLRTNVRGVEMERYAVLPACPVVGMFISDDPQGFGGDRPADRAVMPACRVTEVTYDLGTQMAAVRIDCGEHAWIISDEPEKALASVNLWRCMGFLAAPAEPA